MGDIYEAYQHLNKTFDLGLNKTQLFAAEAQWVSRYAQVARFPAELQKDTSRLMAEWEYQGHLVPRRGRKISKRERVAMR